MALILGFFLVNCILCSVYATSTDTFLITTAIFMGFVLLDRERKEVKNSEDHHTQRREALERTYQTKGYGK